MQKSKKTTILFILFLIIFLSGFIYLFLKVRNLEKTFLFSLKQEEQSLDGTKSLFDLSFSNTCSDECKKEIEEKISQAMATVSATKNVPGVKTPVAQKGTEVTYIPLAGPITTTSTNWVDAVGTDVYIDLASDYGSGAKVTWEAFLKIAHSNGQAFARLFDVTHGIVVQGSEISLTNTDVSTQVPSANLNLWSGRNLYRVQIKSLNSFEVTFGSGRIKIIY